MSDDLGTWGEPWWLWQVVLAVLLVLIILPRFIMECMECCLPVDTDPFRFMSLYYSVLFWVTLPFSVGCLGAQCGHYSKSLLTAAYTGISIATLISMLLMVVETCICEERRCLQMMEEMETGSRSWWVGEKQLWVATALGLTWPYRWLFRHKMEEAGIGASKLEVAPAANERAPSEGQSEAEPLLANIHVQVYGRL